MLARDLSGKGPRPESTIIVLMALGKSAIEDVHRRSSGKHFLGGHSEKARRVAQAPQPIRLTKS